MGFCIYYICYILRNRLAYYTFSELIKLISDIYACSMNSPNEVILGKVFMFWKKNIKIKLNKSYNFSFYSFFVLVSVYLVVILSKV